MDLLLFGLILFFCTFSCSFVGATLNTRDTYFPSNEGSKHYWEQSAQSNLREVLSRELNRNFAKNVIFFLGDGMGITPNTAARIYRGQKEKLNSEQEPLSWEKFAHAGLVKTYAVDYHTTDSACSATAFLCGSKGHSATLGVGPEVPMQTVCDNDVIKRHSVDSVAAWAIKEGKWAGLVTTTRVTHATPAGLYAHTANRDWEDDSKINGTGCKDIARQLVENFPGKEFKVILGGGRRHFLPNTTKDMEINYENQSQTLYGRRQDDYDLISRWKRNGGRRQFVFNASQLEDADLETTDYLLGLFDYSHMEYQLTHEQNGRTDNPSIVDMTEKAIQMLRKNKDGFFLLVEGGRIDHALHRNHGYKTLEETLYFHRAVQKGIIRKFIDKKELEKNRTDGMPTTVLIFANGPAAYLHNETGGFRRNLSDIDTETPEFQHPAFVPLNYETHSGEDVGIWADGPFSHLFTGTIENNYIAHAMAFALCAGPSKEACLKTRSQRDNIDHKKDFRSLRSLLIVAVALSSICLLCFLLLLLLFYMRYFHTKKPTTRPQQIYMGVRNQSFEAEK